MGGSESPGPGQVTARADPERQTEYSGRLFWPVSAGVSLLSTTSCVLTILSDLRIFPLPFLQGMIYVLLLFFAAALWMSFLGGAWLLLSAPSDDFGTLTLRGRRVSSRTWRTALLVCYAAPWVALAVLMLCMIRR